jgi:hypothetical protein
LPYFEWRGGIERRTSVQAHLKSTRQKEGRDLPVGRKRSQEGEKGPKRTKVRASDPLRLVPGIHESNLGCHHEIK